VLIIPVSFAFVEYLSHRFGGDGKGTTMDSKHPPKPAEDDGARLPSHAEGGHA
jgi:HAE1 family hydrophobic/amphiphilic exporter-1